MPDPRTATASTQRPGLLSKPSGSAACGVASTRAGSAPLSGSLPVANSHLACQAGPGVDGRARGVDADEAVMRMGDPVPPMFFFRDPDGNQFLLVERD